MGPIAELANKIAVTRRLLAREHTDEADLDPIVFHMIQQELAADLPLLEAKLAWHRDGAPERRGWREYLGQVAA